MKIIYWFIFFLFVISKFPFPTMAMEPTDQEWLKARKIRILAADDDPVIQLILEKTFKGICTLQIVNDGQELVKRFHPSKFDLVLTDGNMPEKDGYEATEELCRNFSGILIVAVTANIEPAEIEKFKNAGARKVVGKPINKNTLFSEIRKVLSQRLKD